MTAADATDKNVIKLTMKPYNAALAKTTSFFTDYAPEAILAQLTDTLSSEHIPYEISNKTWKLCYTKEKADDEVEANLKEQNIVIKEQAIVQIEMFDAGNGRICVEFKRKQGSSMIFYDQFTKLMDELSHCNNLQM